MRVRLRLVLPGLLTLVGVTVVLAAPAAQSVALLPSEFPNGMKIVPNLTGLTPAGKLSADDVPFGLTVKQLRAAGITSIYTQAFAPPAMKDPMASFTWIYMAFSREAGARTIYSVWVKKFKYPFVQDKGPATACPQGRYMSVVSMPPPQWGMMCRSGPYVILGHFGTKSGVTQLMHTVVSRTR